MMLQHGLRQRLADLLWVSSQRPEAHLFSQVQACCLFIGYARSGHSLVGSFLNAHRHAVIAHELNLLWYARLGLSRQRLFGLMVQRDRWFAGRDRRWFDYDYEVPGQWQGRFETIRVIGDKKGSHTTRFLAGNPRLLDRLGTKLACPLRFVHVVRNPFDNISTMFRRQKVSYPLETSIQRYLERSEANAALLERIGPENVHVVRLEELIASPKETLASLCAFFSLDAPAD